MSYGTDEGFADWLAAQGLTLPAGSPSAGILRKIGSDYIDAAYEGSLSCSRRTGGFSQELAWPRTGHVVNCQHVPDDLIPSAWVNASYRAAYLQATMAGWATNSSDATRLVKREKLSVIEQEYFSPSDTAGMSSVSSGMPSDSIIDGMVSIWLCSKSRSLNSLFMVI